MAVETKNQRVTKRVRRLRFLRFPLVSRLRELRALRAARREAAEDAWLNAEADAALVEPGESIPLEQVLRELNL